jgi:hypothetical protein
MIALDTHARKQPAICGDWYISNVSATVPILNGFSLNLALTFRPAKWAPRCPEQPANKGTGRPGKLRMAAAQARH